MTSVVVEAVVFGGVLKAVLMSVACRYSSYLMWLWLSCCRIRNFIIFGVLIIRRVGMAINGFVFFEFFMVAVVSRFSFTIGSSVVSAR